MAIQHRESTTTNLIADAAFPVRPVEALAARGTATLLRNETAAVDILITCGVRNWIDGVIPTALSEIGCAGPSCKQPGRFQLVRRAQAGTGVPAGNPTVAGRSLITGDQWKDILPPGQIACASRACWAPRITIDVRV